MKYDLTTCDDTVENYTVGREFDVGASQHKECSAGIGIEVDNTGTAPAVDFDTADIG